ncbi:hypothetical protein [Engelhardtia mirabilis]|uniref:Signal peptidase I n=1 Tax=Engelhardtia mirabilis TaxID=2528011 RepID=A0A518BKR4_9BACT|nr:hypothetical protein Pla133_26580 [Planctomycetes bacterium Pla133]QDV01896.1 hypothetical protein Pla86_26570 [Planctomycetes bacterium Pla86]
MSPSRFLLVTRRAVLIVAAAGLGYLFWRADMLTLPEQGCSPLHGFAPGDRVIVDRRPKELGPGAAVLFEGRAGELLLGRVVDAPRDLDPAARALIERGALWIETERDDCPGNDSDDLGPIATERVVARLIMAVGW